MVYRENLIKMDDKSGYPYFRNPPFIPASDFIQARGYIRTSWLPRVCDVTFTLVTTKKWGNPDALAGVVKENAHQQSRSIRSGTAVMFVGL